MRILVCLPNAVATFRASHEQIAALAARLPQHDVRALAEPTELDEQLAEADAVVVWRFDASLYARAPRLRHVFTPAAGRERVEPDPSGRARVHNGAFHGKIMAESLLGMILFMNRRFASAEDARRAHIWDRSAYENTRLLAGQSALIVGYGKIGRHIARALAPLGMRVFGLKRQTAGSTLEPELTRLFAAAELHSALELADHVVVVLPSDTGTDHLLDAAAFACMRPTACVYNLGRGNAIDSEALRAALHARRIAGAFLDVFESEPLPADSPLWEVPNLHITPHASAMSREYLDLYFDELASLISNLEPGA